MADLVINDDTVIVAMPATEKAEAMNRDLTFPRSAVTTVRAAVTSFS